MNFKSKNLILIIGNGFDIAHDMPTSFNDFAQHIIKDIIVPSILKKEPNSLIKLNELIAFIDNDLDSSIELDAIDTEKLEHYIKNEDPLSNILIDSFASFFLEKPEIISQIITNNFLGKLFSDQYNNWFDIEKAYFTELTNIYNKSKASEKSEDIFHLKNSKRKSETKTLNENLQEIKDLLVSYLEKINPTRNHRIEKFFLEIKEKYELSPLANNKLYIITFNYTSTLYNYFNNHSPGINYIHGDLKSNNIIFGYGNDMHPIYQELKGTEQDSFLKYFKTFEYTNSPNYTDVYDKALNFYKEYDVAILGHSLGQTDKTLLKEILGNKKCKRIHLFKRSDFPENPNEKIQKEFDTLVYALGRIIDNDSDLRIKVLNFKDSSFFPN